MDTIQLQIWGGTVCSVLWDVNATFDLKLDVTGYNLLFPVGFARVWNPLIHHSGIAVVWLLVYICLQHSSVGLSHTKVRGTLLQCCPVLCTSIVSAKPAYSGHPLGNCTAR